MKLVIEVSDEDLDSRIDALIQSRVDAVLSSGLSDARLQMFVNEYLDKQGLLRFIRTTIHNNFGKLVKRGKL